jgi:hypothetical protein
MTDQAIFQGFTETELSAAFDLVADPCDWRAPVNAVVDSEHWGAVQAAVRFYTATEPTYDLTVSRKLLVRAAGYRAGPAGP